VLIRTEKSALTHRHFHSQHTSHFVIRDCAVCFAARGSHTWTAGNAGKGARRKKTELKLVFVAVGRSVSAEGSRGRGIFIPSRIVKSGSMWIIPVKLFVIGGQRGRRHITGALLLPSLCIQHISKFKMAARAESTIDKKVR
jgi:hypothetical protein